MSIRVDYKSTAPCWASRGQLRLSAGPAEKLRSGGVLSMNSGLVAGLTLRRCREVLAFVDYRIEVRPFVHCTRYGAWLNYLSGCRLVFSFGGIGLRRQIW